MSVYLTEEEQAEKFKRWWATNGSRVIIVVVAGIALYWAWTQWQAQHQQQAAEASTVYSAMVDLVAGNLDSAAEHTAETEIIDLAERLKTDFSDSQYARYAALILAKLAVDKQQYAEANAELDWAQSGADEGLSRIVTLRKARIEVAQGNLESALTLLESVDAQEMSSVYAEARGDIYFQLGNTDAARSAYQEAVSTVAGNQANAQILELKLNRVTPADQQAVITEDSEIDLSGLEATDNVSLNTAE